MEKIEKKRKDTTRQEREKKKKNNFFLKHIYQNKFTKNYMYSVGFLTSFSSNFFFCTDIFFLLTYFFFLFLFFICFCSFFLPPPLPFPPCSSFLIFLFIPQPISFICCNSNVSNSSLFKRLICQQIQLILEGQTSE